MIAFLGPFANLRDRGRPLETAGRRSQTQVSVCASDSNLLAQSPPCKTLWCRMIPPGCLMTDVCVACGTGRDRGRRTKTYEDGRRPRKTLRDAGRPREDLGRRSQTA